MYDLPYHKENDPQVVRDFIQRYPLTTLTGCDVEQRTVAMQIPLFIEDVYSRELLGHKSSKTTERYTHVSKRTKQNVPNPLNQLDL